MIRNSFVYYRRTRRLARRNRVAVCVFRIIVQIRAHFAMRLIEIDMLSLVFEINTTVGRIPCDAALRTDVFAVTLYIEIRARDFGTDIAYAGRIGAYIISTVIDVHLYVGIDYFF